MRKPEKQEQHEKKPQKHENAAQKQELARRLRTSRYRFSIYYNVHSTLSQDRYAVGCPTEVPTEHSSKKQNDGSRRLLASSLPNMTGYGAQGCPTLYFL